MTDCVVGARSGCSGTTDVAWAGREQVAVTGALIVMRRTACAVSARPRAGQASGRPGAPARAWAHAEALTDWRHPGARGAARRTAIRERTAGRVREDGGRLCAPGDRSLLSPRAGSAVTCPIGALRSVPDKQSVVLSLGALWQVSQRGPECRAGDALDRLASGRAGRAGAPPSDHGCVVLVQASAGWVWGWPS